MKAIGFIMLAIALAVTAQAQHSPYYPTIGLFFSDHEFTEANTNIQTSTLDGPFEAHIVVFGSAFFSIAAYDLGIVFDDKVVVLDAWGPNGWTNFGSHTQHAVGYMVPVPNNAGYGGGVVLATLQILHGAAEAVDVFFGPSVYIQDYGFEAPLIWDGNDVENSEDCGYPSGPYNQLVATFNGSGIQFLYGKAMSVEARSWSEVKALFGTD
jgi:hypothetical protein